MNSLEQLLLDQPHVKVIAADRFVSIDLSATNEELARFDTTDSEAFESFIINCLQQNNAQAAFGGYKEVRNLYKRSALFNQNEDAERNIHIGLDIWMTEGTAVFAALNGTVHSFDYNTGLGNYGPTIILEHNIDGIAFFTLYGHLSIDSIESLEIGDVFKKGEPLGALGDSSVNGDYAPHLHFQLIKNIDHYFGDYPGVCSVQDLDFYTKNCPDPQLLLKLKQ